MQREIEGFHRDAEGDWVAELRCGHRQHVRHRPPFTERAWVESASGRAAQVGQTIDCGRCERSEMPAGYCAYHRTPSFDAETTPRALREQHTTKAGVWAQIHVETGSLTYVIDAPFFREERLGPESPGVVLPEVEHRVRVDGAVRFFVEFWRRAP